METIYGFPRTDPGAALAAADALSRRYPEGSIRRLNADNSVDFVGMEGAFLRHRRFHLHRIDAKGWVSLAETTRLLLRIALGSRSSFSQQFSSPARCC